MLNKENFLFTLFTKFTKSLLKLRKLTNVLKQKKIMIIIKQTPTY